MQTKNILLLLLISLITSPITYAAEFIQATKVISSQYQLPANAQTIIGNCWTNSIASNQPNAFRCMVDNTIYDPCFTTEVKDKLVCNVDPNDARTAVILQLNKPLPPPVVTKTKKAQPWLIQLADGTLCRPYTGTTPFTGKFAIPYYCDNFTKLPSDCGTGLVENTIKPGVIWKTQRIIYCASENSMNVTPKHIQSVDIKNVWL